MSEESTFGFNLEDQNDSPIEQLFGGIETFKKRNAKYGDNYKRFGSLMLELFPEGVDLSTEDDFNRYGILTQVVAKLTRYTENFSKGGHADSIHDLMVYSAMLAHLDEESLQGLGGKDEI